MDTLAECAERMDEVFARLLRSLIKQELAIAFYDLTTIRSEGGSEQSDDLHALVAPRREASFVR